MGKKWKITAAIAAAAGAVASAFWLSDKKNRDKAKKKIDDAKSKTVSATKNAQKTATKKAKNVSKKVTKEFKITDVKGIGPKRAKRLKKAGIVTLTQLRTSSQKDLAEKGGVSVSTARKWQNSAKGLK